MVILANSSPEQPQTLPSAAEGYGVPLTDLLALPLLAGAEVLAGSSGLDRTVGGANVMEVPDVLDWVKPRELLVTTGYPLVRPGDAVATGRALVDLVGALADRGLAGLGIKLGRYLDAVPPAALALADERGFPVVALPADLGFDDLLQQVYAGLHERQTALLARIDRLHQALSQLVLAGGDLGQIAAEVSRVLDIGLLVTTTDGRERAAALDPALRDRLVGLDLFDPTGRFRVERASTRPLPLDDGEVRLVPVVAGGTDLARLVCVSLRPVGPDDEHALERAATVAALLVTREQAVAAVENKYRGDFLRDVFLGRAGDDAYVLEHAETLGWDLARPLVVLCAEVDPPGSEEPPVSGRIRRTWQERFAAAWRQVCHARDRGIPTVDFSTEVVTLLPLPEGGDDADGALLRTAVEQVVSAVSGDRGGGRRPFSVGVSRVVTGLGDLPAAYEQARRACEVGRRVTGGRSTTWFDDLGLHRLIALVPDQAELRGFAEDVLGDLAADTPEAADLRTTLQVLLDTNLNVAEAARLQFFHYNTMRYRVGKLERLLGPFTTDPHLRLNVAVALQVLEMQH